MEQIPIADLTDEELDSARRNLIALMQEHRALLQAVKAEIQARATARMTPGAAQTVRPADTPRLASVHSAG